MFRIFLSLTRMLEVGYCREVVQQSAMIAATVGNTEMLVYTTILIVSLLLATISIFIYRAVSNSSRSIYNSKQQIGMIRGAPAPQKDKVARALPTEQFHGGSQAAAQPHGHGTGVGKVSRCSLFDVSAVMDESEHNRVTKRTRREAVITSPANTQGCSLYFSQ